MIVWKLDALMRQRRAKGRQMALRMGIGENYLSRVRHEVPDRLSLAMLDALCRELDCTIGDLLEYRPSTEPPQVAFAELHQEVTPARRRERKAPTPRRVSEAPVAAAPVAPVAAPTPVAAPPVVAAPSVVAAPAPIPGPARERPVLPFMAPLPGTPAPAATSQPAPPRPPAPAPVAVTAPWATAPAPPAELAPALVPAASEAGADAPASEASHYVRLDALQAKLDRLKRRK